MNRCEYRQIEAQALCEIYECAIQQQTKEIQAAGRAWEWKGLCSGPSGTLLLLRSHLRGLSTSHVCLIRESFTWAFFTTYSSIITLRQWLGDSLRHI
jgi:hypothetical protein